MIIYLCWEWDDVVKAFYDEKEAKKWVKNIRKKLSKNYSEQLLEAKYYYTNIEVVE